MLSEESRYSVAMVRASAENDGRQLPACVSDQGSGFITDGIGGPPLVESPKDLAAR